MAVRTSTGFCAAILGTSSFDTLFRDGVMEIYSGAQPASADMAPTGTLLGRVTRDGGAWAAGSPSNGLRFVRGGRYASKDPGQLWLLKGVASGTAGWVRLLPNVADAGGITVDAPRIDGAIGLVGATGDQQLFLPSLSITPATSVEVTYWWYAMPPIGE